jgi:hypothetical protein
LRRRTLTSNRPSEREEITVAESLGREILEAVYARHAADDDAYELPFEGAIALADISDSVRRAAAVHQALEGKLSAAEIKKLAGGEDEQPDTDPAAAEKVDSSS